MSVHCRGSILPPLPATGSGSSKTSGREDVGDLQDVGRIDLSIVDKIVQIIFPEEKF